MTTVYVCDGCGVHGIAETILQRIRLTETNGMDVLFDRHYCGQCYPEVVGVLNQAAREFGRTLTGKVIVT